MNCCSCNRPLLKREHAQAVNVLGWNIRPASACDDCCRAHPWQPGSKEALERLALGKTDPDELARITAAT